jgi:hypothetical protein
MYQPVFPSNPPGTAGTGGPGGGGRGGQRFGPAGVQLMLQELQIQEVEVEV